MLALAVSGAEEALWLRAGRQTQGKGRLARAWESPDGNLYASTIVRLRPGDPAPASLALVAAVAVWRAVEAFLPGKAQIKWPNDILIGPAKLSGMLLERTGDAIVVGIGVNIMAGPDVPDRATTSLWAQGAVDMDAETLLQAISAHFAMLIGIWREAGLDAIRPLWIAAAHPKGTALKAALPDGMTVEGRFVDLDRDGALILDLPGGGTHVVHAGDLFLV